MITKAQLAAFVKKRGVQFGEFKLKSGATASYYIDCRRFTIGPDMTALATAFAEVLKKEVVVYDAVGGPALGACPLVMGVSMLTQKRACFVRSDAKDHGKSDLVIGSIQKGDKVVVLEDVTTSGESLMAAADALKDFGCIVMHAITLVDRGTGAASLFKSREIPFTSLLTIEDLGLE
jgi:orotate phosphoribosyltransferase